MDVFIVCGYGCDPQGKMIQKYISFSAALIGKTPSGSVVITAGGYTQPKRFKISEAQMMKSELERRGIGIIHPILLEERSITSPQNIENAFKIVKKISADTVTIICDSIRAPKIKVFAKRCLRQQRMAVKLKVEGFDFKRPRKEKMVQVVKSLVEILGMWFPFINKIAASVREKRIREKDF